MRAVLWEHGGIGAPGAPGPTWRREWVLPRQTLQGVAPPFPAPAGHPARRPGSHCRGCAAPSAGCLRRRARTLALPPGPGLAALRSGSLPPLPSGQSRRTRPGPGQQGPGSAVPPRAAAIGRCCPADAPRGYGGWCLSRRLADHGSRVHRSARPGAGVKQDCRWPAAAPPRLPLRCRAAGPRPSSPHVT